MSGQAEEKLTGRPLSLALKDVGELVKPDPKLHFLKGKYSRGEKSCFQVFSSVFTWHIIHCLAQFGEEPVPLSYNVGDYQWFSFTGAKFPKRGTPNFAQPQCTPLNLEAWSNDHNSHCHLQCVCVCLCSKQKKNSLITHMELLNTRFPLVLMTKTNTKRLTRDAACKSWFNLQESQVKWREIQLLSPCLLTRAAAWQRTKLKSQLPYKGCSF